MSKYFRFRLSDGDLLNKLRCAEGLGARLAVDSERDVTRAREIAAENDISVTVIIRAHERRIG